VTATFALESMMDELAHELRLDPIELRLRNEPEFDQVTGLPFTTPGSAVLPARRAGVRLVAAQPHPSHRPGGRAADRAGMAAAVHHTTARRRPRSPRSNADGTAWSSSAP